MKAIVAGAIVLAMGTGLVAAAERGLPEICKSPGHSGHDMGAMVMEAPIAETDEAHAAMMAGMDKMHADMGEGMQAADIDVAFVCGMIPHHQGAIDMARAELQYGDDPWVKQMAQNVIVAQEAEIAQMREWLAEVAP